LLASRSSPERVAASVRKTIADEFGLDIAVVTRSRDELALVVRRNPLRGVAIDPRRHQVSFFERSLDAATVRRLEAVALAQERVVISGREAYTWHPAGIARSKLWAAVASRG